MFQNEKPIEKAGEDKLERLSFSNNLAKSILEWKGIDSLVLALNGKWGSGKSSVINLAKAELLNTSKESQPTIIEFNPWLFSGEEKLNEHFFNEIAKELEIRKSPDGDKQIANRLRQYSQLLNLIPNESQSSAIIKNVLVVVAILGISAQQILQWFNIQSKHSSTVLFIVSLCLLLLSLANSALKKIADFFDARSVANNKSILSFKEDIKKSLEKRKNKILIIIDDIDRLTSEEVRILFKIIKINSDFPNVIYLLSFDREVVKKALEVQDGVNGQDYLEKIVQVSFDIPLANQEKISKILIDECNIILKRLPKSSDILVNEEYWNTIYSSGLKGLFRNIRDVKRFASSLEFNLSFLFKGDSMEVNPIDFMAIEAIRIFAPEFYSFMRSKKTLFTSSDSHNNEISASRRKEIEDELNKLDEPLRDNIKGLIPKLFPQISKLLSINPSLFGTFYSPQEAVKRLKVCSPSYFDTYFALIPGGSESELSQFEIDSFLSVLNDKAALEIQLKSIIDRKRISQLLGRIESYTSDLSKMPNNCIPNFIEAYLDISDNLPEEQKGHWGFGLDSQFDRVIFQLLHRNDNSENNFDVLKNAFSASKGLYGAIELVWVLSSKNGKSDLQTLIPEGKIVELQKECIRKIKECADSNTLVEKKNFGFILFRWKEWSDSKDWETYFKTATETSKGLLENIKHFIGTMNTTSGSGTTSHNYFSYDTLDHIVSSDDIKLRLEKIKTDEPELYQEYKPLIDMFLNNFRNDPRNI